MATRTDFEFMQLRRRRAGQLGFRPVTFVGDTSQLGGDLGFPWGEDFPGGSTVPQQPRPQGSSNFQHYFDAVIGQISQIVSAYGGANSGNQISPSGQVIPVPQAQINSSAPQVVYQPGQNPYERPAGNTAIGGGIDGLVNLITENPGTTALILGGVYLLFRESPSSKRR